MERPAAAVAPVAQALTSTAASLPPPRSIWRVVVPIPLAVIVAFGIHRFLPNNEVAADASLYSKFLYGLLGVAMLLVVLQAFWRPLKDWLWETGPIVAAAAVTLGIWELCTGVLRLLPMPYFPAPAGVIQAMVSDRALLFDSTWHSLILLLGGYSLGAVIALVTGVCIGWSPRVRYWGMPLLKIVGPIPATAWIPLAMVLSPSGVLSAVGLIALAVWFPVTMLTASGISNTRASYLDVARTLGAGRMYLIFRVAIPAALPNIFIGLFMGLGTSFLTLVVAETVGVKSGLGWYVGWAQGWAEYGKVFAALIIMAAFFSTIMTVLFKLRDRVLGWQKGFIKW